MKTPASLESFVDTCVACAPDRDHAGVSEALRDLLTEPGDFAATVPPFAEVETSPRGWTLGGEHVCHRSEELTVLILDTLPGVKQPPHDHAMTAIIGVFEGREDQRFYARAADGVTETAGRSLGAGDVIVLGEGAIHAISAPAGQAARAIHVYFGDIYDVDRSLFHPDTLEPVPYSGDCYDEFCRPDG